EAEHLGREVEGHGLDEVALAETVDPSLRDGTPPELDAEQVAGDGARAVRVAGVVHRVAHALLEGRRGERGVEGDGQRLLPGPAGAQPLDQLRGGLGPAMG